MQGGSFNLASLNYQQQLWKCATLLFNSNLIGCLKNSTNQNAWNKHRVILRGKIYLKDPRPLVSKFILQSRFWVAFRNVKFRFGLLLGSRLLINGWVWIWKGEYNFLQTHLLFRMKKVNPSAAAVLISGFESPKFCIKIIEMVVIVVWTVWPDGFIIFNIWPRTT